MRSFRSKRLVLSATSALGLAGTSRRGGAGGIGAWVSPGPWRTKPPGPIERYWMPSGCGRCGLRAGWAGDSSSAAGAARRVDESLRAVDLPEAGFLSFSSPGLTGEGRASRPRRCALPMTALRLTPPSSSAIWLAVAPSAHIFFSRSIRSSVQDIDHLLRFQPQDLGLRRLPPADRRATGEQPAPEKPRRGRERASTAMASQRAWRADPDRGQLGWPQDPIYQGGAPLLQGADPDGVGAGGDDLAVPGDIHRRARPWREDRDGGPVRR